MLRSQLIGSQSVPGRAVTTTMATPSNPVPPVGRRDMAEKESRQPKYVTFAFDNPYLLSNLEHTWYIITFCKIFIFFILKGY